MTIWTVTVNDQTPDQLASLHQDGDLKGIVNTRTILDFMAALDAIARNASSTPASPVDLEAVMRGMMGTAVSALARVFPNGAAHPPAQPEEPPKRMINLGHDLDPRGAVTKALPTYPPWVSLGRDLRQLRRTFDRRDGKVGLRQVELGDMTGVACSSISYYENAQRPISAEHMAALVGVLVNDPAERMRLMERMDIARSQTPDLRRVGKGAGRGGDRRSASFREKRLGRD
jgi:hypothetical protein